MRLGDGQLNVRSPQAGRLPIALMGVRFDNVTLIEALNQIEQMIASGRPHYVVTPNVDFLVQAREDVELRRILCEADLVVCDGTPLVWASRLLGNALPERVAGADLVPALLKIAAEKQYRVFLLGATPESAQQAVTSLRAEHPRLPVVGHYSPPFNSLLEMNHAEISRRIRDAAPDILFVSLGCPKQEKWIAMHYHSLGVPVTAGVGATIDFLGGAMRRAPIWMQRSGTEWLFRLIQEPRRLLKRYAKDFWVFGRCLFAHQFLLRSRTPRAPSGLAPLPESRSTTGPARSQSNGTCDSVRLPSRLEMASIRSGAAFDRKIFETNRHLLVEADRVEFVDSTGIGLLIYIRKKLRTQGRQMVLVAPSPALRRALKLMRLSDLFRCTPDMAGAYEAVTEDSLDCVLSKSHPTAGTPEALLWRGEITAANAELVWGKSQAYFASLPVGARWSIDLSEVRFIDSTGLGLMIRARKLADERRKELRFENLTAPVRNVLQLARLEAFLLDPCQPNRSTERQS